MNKNVKKFLLEFEEYCKLRKEIIRTHFLEICKDAKNGEQINAFYNQLIKCFIIPIIQAKGEIDYQGLTLKIFDIQIIEDILEEHNQKIKMLKNLK